MENDTDDAMGEKGFVARTAGQAPRDERRKGPAEESRGGRKRGRMDEECEAKIMYVPTNPPPVTVYLAIV